jgi:TatD DNase family protein
MPERQRRRGMSGPAPSDGRLHAARLVDAHNHLQDERFGGRQDELIAAAREAGVVRMVVNGSCEEDWPAVADLARRAPDLVIPAFGLHPWHLCGRTPQWRDRLREFLETTPGATVGEIGLDRWILESPPAARAAIDPDLATRQAAPLAEQMEVFCEQLRIAAEHNVPASIHCLQAWGPLVECLRNTPRPSVGFLLHSYGGSADLVRPLARLGARFSFPGYFLHARKRRQRETFRSVPADRLLTETDAPDQRLPGREPWADEIRPDALPAVEEITDAKGRPLNHPRNLAVVVAGLAAVLGESVPDLAERVEGNFARLFGLGRTEGPAA